jgi:HAD superfamily hydrolase (TIGR01509 family)
MGVIGGLAARGERHTRVWEILGVQRPPTRQGGGVAFYPDALRCLAALRLRGVSVGIVGNTPEWVERELHPFADVVGSSARWGVEKPAPAFFARVVDELGVRASAIAYVGDRVDNDVLPAKRAGMFAVHIRRGPWGYLHDASGADAQIDSLDELPGVLP